MKKFLLFISLMAFTAGLQAQCPSGTITLTTQAEVNTFASTYPACTELPGALLIGDVTFPFTGSSDISDLSPLSNLNSIGGRLTINRSSSLTSLAGLENLNSIEGNLTILFNSSLTSLAALENLNSIGGFLQINSNNSLASLAGLENLNSIGEDLFISNNSSLASLAGLENLNSIEGNLSITSNSSLASLAALENLNSIGEGLSISNNSSLASLAGLENINSIASLFIGYSSSLTSLAALENLNSSIGGRLQILSNSSLTSLAGLDGISSVGENLQISSNGSLTSLAGLDGISSVGGNLQISSNGSLTSLAGLENLNSIGGFLQILFNSSLTSLTGLENLNSIGIGFLEIRSNISLTNCSIDAVCDKLEDPNAFILIFSNAPGCNSPAEVEDNCGSALEALCQNATISIGANGQVVLSPSLVDDNSVTAGSASFSVSPSTFDCNNIGPNTVTLTVTEGGNSDDCTATVTVQDGVGLPGSWDGTDIGTTSTAGNNYNFEACNASIPNQFSVTGSGNNATSMMSDNIAFASQTLCGDGSITAKIENVDASGYGGLMIRETTAAGSKQVAIFSNMSSILRHESRTMTNMPKTIQSFFKPSPTWLRMRRQGDWVHVEYSNNGMMYLPVQSTFVMMSSCVEIGLASFTFLPTGQTSATFSNVATTGTIQDLSGDTPTTFAVDPSIPQNQNTKTPQNLQLFPNPTSHHFTLQLETPLQEEAMVEVINLYGQSMAQQRLGAGQVVQQWNVANWPVGTYMMRLNRAGQAPMVKQFVVSR